MSRTRRDERFGGCTGLCTCWRHRYSCCASDDSLRNYRNISTVSQNILGKWDFCVGLKIFIIPFSETPGDFPKKRYPKLSTLSRQNRFAETAGTFRFPHTVQISCSIRHARPRFGLSDCRELTSLPPRSCCTPSLPHPHPSDTLIPQASPANSPLPPKLTHPSCSKHA